LPGVQMGRRRGSGWLSDDHGAQAAAGVLGSDETFEEGSQGPERLGFAAVADPYPVSRLLGGLIIHGWLPSEHDGGDAVLRPAAGSSSSAQPSQDTRLRQHGEAIRNAPVLDDPALGHAGHVEDKEIHRVAAGWAEERAG